MRVWLDDERPMPEGFDLWVKNAYYLLPLIRQNEVSFISFDHDLGGGENNTGYAVASQIDKWAHDGILNPIAWECHSMNPAGREAIIRAMMSADRWWYRDREPHKRKGES